MDILDMLAMRMMEQAGPLIQQDSTILLDTFMGSAGNLAGHIPETNPHNRSWSAINSTISLNGSGRAVSLINNPNPSRYAIDVGQNEYEIITRFNTGGAASIQYGVGLLTRIAEDGSSGLATTLSPAYWHDWRIGAWSGGAGNNLPTDPIYKLAPSLALSEQTDYWMKVGVYGHCLHCWIGAGTPIDPTNITWEWLTCLDSYQKNTDVNVRWAEFGVNPTSTIIGIGMQAMNGSISAAWDYLKIIKPATVKRILWLGDSLISNNGTDSNTARPFARQVSSQYNNGHTEQVNLAFSGSGVIQVDAYLQRLRDQIASAPAGVTFDRIIIGSGVNDNGYDATWDTEADYCITQIKSKWPAAKILWLGLWPGQASGRDTTANPAIQTVCTNNTITYVSPSGSGIVSGDYADGVHLTPSGNDKAMATVLAAIA